MDSLAKGPHPPRAPDPDLITISSNKKDPEPSLTTIDMDKRSISPSCQRSLHHSNAADQPKASAAMHSLSDPNTRPSSADGDAVEVPDLQPAQGRKPVNRQTVDRCVAGDTAAPKTEDAASSAIRPSRFCHICQRTAAKTGKAHIPCATATAKSCRKAVCWICVESNSLHWPGKDQYVAKVRINEPVVCPHCSGSCPVRAQCTTYRKVNLKRSLSYQLTPPSSIPRPSQAGEPPANWPNCLYLNGLKSLSDGSCPCSLCLSTKKLISHSAAITQGNAASNVQLAEVTNPTSATLIDPHDLFAQGYSNQSIEPAVFDLAFGTGFSASIDAALGTQYASGAYEQERQACPVPFRVPSVAELISARGMAQLPKTDVNVNHTSKFDHQLLLSRSPVDFPGEEALQSLGVPADLNGGIGLMPDIGQGSAGDALVELENDIQMYNPSPAVPDFPALDTYFLSLGEGLVPSISKANANEDVPMEFRNDLLINSYGVIADDEAQTVANTAATNEDEEGWVVLRDGMKSDENVIDSRRGG